jgi:hypothetical protein
MTIPESKRQRYVSPDGSRFEVPSTPAEQIRLQAAGWRPEEAKPSRKSRISTKQARKATTTPDEGSPAKDGEA